MPMYGQYVVECKDIIIKSILESGNIKHPKKQHLKTYHLVKGHHLTD